MLKNVLESKVAKQAHQNPYLQAQTPKTEGENFLWHLFQMVGLNEPTEGTHKDRALWEWKIILFDLWKEL